MEKKIFNFYQQKSSNTDLGFYKDFCKNLTDKKRVAKDYHPATLFFYFVINYFTTMICLSFVPEASCVYCLVFTSIFTV